MSIHRLASGVDTKDEVGGRPKPQEYLGAFQQLGPQIHFYRPTLNDATKRPESSSTTSTVPEPNLIIVCSWLAAAPRHIAKYTNSYLSKYPHIPTLLIQCSQVNVMVKSESDQVQEMQPAITAIQSVFGGASTEPRVLMHNFSNGGCWSAKILAQAYHQGTAGLSLPITALVLDSCPSFPREQLLYRELSTALPKNIVINFLGSILVWLFVYAVRILNQLSLKENVITNIRRTLNDPAGPFIKGGLPRTYICSKTDAMIPIGDVKKHAEEAEGLIQKLGFSDEDAETRVGFEEFQGSAHVGHLMVDKERYWNIVQSTWDSGMKLQTQAIDKLKRGT